MFIDWNAFLRNLSGEWSVLCAGKKPWGYANSSATIHRFNDFDEAIEFYNEYLADLAEEEAEAKRDPMYHYKKEESLGRLLLDNQIIMEYNPDKIDTSKISRWSKVNPPIKWAKDAPPTKTWVVTGRRP